MAELSIPTVLSLPAVSVLPSVRCLQFSQDGQIVLLTKQAVYILTPDTGVNVELSSVIRQTLDSKSSGRGSTRPVGWLRTIVEFDRSLAHQWASDCADWGAVSLGSLDPALQAVALSPSNITADAGSVLALLNSNFELTIWGASKNMLTGEWIRLQDVTSDLKTTAAASDSPAFRQTLRLQSTCVEWSSQPDWNLTPIPAIDASLLAVGNCAGSVTFLRYDEDDRRMSAVAEVSVCDRWATHIAWSAWTYSQAATCEAMLSYGASDGSVVILTVRQTLNSSASLSHFLPHYDVGLSVHVKEKVSEADGRAITGMVWANLNGRSPILIYHKAGIIHLWSAPLNSPPWSGSRVLSLQTQKRSVGSSALSPASGIYYVPNRDILVVSLSDGSFHVIHNLSDNPTFDPSSSAGVSSAALSAASRSIFLRAHTEKISLKDVDRINGMTTYDGYSTFIWTYEASRPTDFSYKHDAKHVSTLVVAQLWNENVDRIIFDFLERVGRTRYVNGETPICVLRPIFLHLRDPSNITRLYPRILDILGQPLSNGRFPEYGVPDYTGGRTAEVSRELRQSLTAHLFGWDAIQSYRIRYAVSTFCQAHAEAPDVQQKFAGIASLFLTYIQTHVQLAVIRHISAISGLLNPDDIYFARRAIHQAATSSGALPALVKEAEELLARLPPSPPRLAPSEDSRLGDPRPISTSDVAHELCPACNVPIPFLPTDVESAVCGNGHVWARCCITSFLLATPMVRTCIGCSRKAFLPPPAATPEAAAQPPPKGDSNGDRDRVGHSNAHESHPASSGDVCGLPSLVRNSWFVQDLLDAIRRCPFCGNNFVVLV